MNRLVRIDLSIIIPAFNEREQIVATLRSIIQYVDRRSHAAELIVSADGTDGTREAAQELSAADPRIRVIGSPERRGKGRGVREGMLLAGGRFVGFVDADGKTPIDQLDLLLPHLEAGADVVIGSRKIIGARIDRRQPFYRRAGSELFGRVVRGWMGVGPVRDTQCGFKFFQHDVARRLFSLQHTDGYMFDVELLRLARLLKYKVVEVPVRWRDDGDTRYDPIRGTLRNARELWRISRLKYPGVNAPPVNA